MKLWKKHTPKRALHADTEISATFIFEFSPLASFSLVFSLFIALSLLPLLFYPTDCLCEGECRSQDGRHAAWLGFVILRVMRTTCGETRRPM